MRILLFALMIFTCAQLCAGDHELIPAWLQQKLEAYRDTGSMTSAEKTEYQGKVVYYIYPRCCDIPSELYTENGKLICHPDGGFAGGDGKCPDFRFSSEEKQ